MVFTINYVIPHKYHLDFFQGLLYNSLQRIARAKLRR